MSITIQDNIGDGSGNGGIFKDGVLVARVTASGFLIPTKNRIALAIGTITAGQIIVDAIPPWVTKVSLFFNLLTVSAAGQLGIRLYDNGTQVIAGYSDMIQFVAASSSGMATTSTDRFPLSGTGVDNTYQLSAPKIEFIKNGNTWSIISDTTLSGASALMYRTTGVVPCSLLTRIQLFHSAGNITGGSGFAAILE